MAYFPDCGGLPVKHWAQGSDLRPSHLPKPQPRDVKEIKKTGGGVAVKSQVHISHLDHRWGPEQLHSD